MKPYAIGIDVVGTKIAVGLVSRDGAIRAKLDGREPSELELNFPTVNDGARGVKFIQKVVDNGRSEEKWTTF